MAGSPRTKPSPSNGGRARSTISRRPAARPCAGDLTHNEPIDFPSIEELREQGHTDYLALVQRFAGDGVIGEMDCVSSSWSTDAPGGFRTGRSSSCERLVARPCARHQVRLARPHRGHPGRDLSRPRRRAPGAGRTHRAWSRRPDRHGAVVLRPAWLHARSPTPPHRSRSSRCSTTMPKRSSPPSTTPAATC